MSKTQTLVIVGAGVVGCSIAAALAEKFQEVYVLETAPRAGMMTSTRNSGVIHSGIYYAPGSLKARLCLRGNQLLREFCEKRGVPWRACGKLVIATQPGQLAALAELKARGEANGVAGLELVDAEFVRRREPHVQAVEALFVPSTGIVQTERLMQALVAWARERGAEFAFRSSLAGAQPIAGGGYRLQMADGSHFHADLVINCAGLFADEVARWFGDDDHRITPCRGEYARLRSGRKENLVHGLVYPLPTANSLGIHLTRTVDGETLIGPTARFQDSKTDYESDLLPESYFWEQTREFLPEIEAGDLCLAYTGIRPRLAGRSVPSPGSGHLATVAHDFVVEWSQESPGVLHLIGIDSPGLTAALALAEEVKGMVSAASA